MKLYFIQQIANVLQNAKKNPYPYQHRIGIPTVHNDLLIFHCIVIRSESTVTPLALHQPLNNFNYSKYLTLL